TADLGGSKCYGKHPSSQTLGRTHVGLCQSSRTLWRADRATRRGAWQFPAGVYTSFIDQRRLQSGPRIGHPNLNVYDASLLSSGASGFVQSVESGSIALRTTSNGLITPTTFPLSSILTTGSRSTSPRSNTTDAS